eukprot:Anaeramoba_ignava/a218039_9.p1 GENE.a218039_9~~a218039_9.p1  ORF type:complete len:374 (-),score=141.00 a218039_9:73-1167(-)
MSDQFSQKISILQTSLKMQYAKKQYEQLLKQQSRRAEAIQEILKTEQNYVEGLTTLVEVYVIPLKRETQKKKGMINEDEYKAIFNNCMRIYHLHREKIYNSLILRFEEFLHQKMIGDIFVDFSGYLDLYFDYCKNYRKAVNLVNSLRKKKDPFEAFLEKGRNLERSNSLDIFNFMILPVQRIPRYHLMLQAILKYTTQEHPDFNHLQKAIEKINEIASKIDFQVKSNENISTLTQIQETFDTNSMIQIVKEGRIFLQSGVLGKLSSHGTLQKRQFYLFNDLLIYGTKVFTKLKPKIPLNINTSWIQDFPQNKIKNAFFIVGIKRTLIISCESAEEKQKWINKLSNVIEKFVQQFPNYIEQRKKN